MPGPIKDQKIRDDVRLATAESLARERFPLLGKQEFRVQRGEGPGFAEFFPADEKFNPNPGTPTIEVRKTDLPVSELEAVIIGDALHLLPSTVPEFGKLKKDFIASMRPEQVQVVEEMLAENRERSGDERTLEEFMDQSGADAFIRDFIFQRMGNVPGGKPFVEGLGPIMGGFFPENMTALEAIEALLAAPQQ